ncbi:MULTISPECIES: class I SAM-dependent methyltransferase [Paenibacillus]|uniref:Methyltransferase family protein n=1 Tax=Paenibacillus pabuli TaxID=1472 RepID=A0A855Y567_9BACL|nr:MULTISPECIES: class I SAM-dependent methyltransferase [Paenibacillus]PWW37448.1 methyltransferase family protein [Paenibacillus pabuli]PXW05590.1 methyltransferase family protein [Paenibacillus taichungensis]RAI98874.1 methyltransferase family protein [Paenibacillus pabuli]
MWDQAWEEVFKSQEWGKYPSEDLIRFVARNFYRFEDRKEIKVLEVGCGTGSNLWYVSREGFSVYGIDGSKTAIEKAKKRLDSEFSKWSGELLVGDITSLPYEDEEFDAVIDNEAIYANSYENSITIYNEIYRVLKKGGKLYSRTFATGSWGDGTGEKVGYNTWLPIVGPSKDKGITRFSSKNDVEEFMRNFNIEEMEKVSRSYNNLHDNVIEWIVTASKK